MTSAREADFRAWVMHHRDRLRTTAYLLCGDWHLADDLVQEALGRLYSIWDRVTASGDPRSYAYRILCNLSTDHRRRPARREISQPDVDASRSAADGTASEERDDDVLAALRLIPPGQRRVLVLRFFEDLSVERTAAVLNTTTGNVKSQTSRGLDAMRSALRIR